MHIVGVIGLLGGLIWYAFGPTAARIFVGLSLAIGAIAALLLMGLIVTVLHRDGVQNRTPVHFETRYVRN